MFYGFISNVQGLSCRLWMPLSHLYGNFQTTLGRSSSTITAVSYLFWKRLMCINGPTLILGDCIILHSYKLISSNIFRLNIVCPSWLSANLGSRNLGVQDYCITRVLPRKQFIVLGTFYTWLIQILYPNVCRMMLPRIKTHRKAY